MSSSCLSKDPNSEVYQKKSQCKEDSTTEDSSCDSETCKASFSYGNKNTCEITKCKQNGLDKSDQDHMINSCAEILDITHSIILELITKCLRPVLNESFVKVDRSVNLICTHVTSNSNFLEEISKDIAKQMNNMVTKNDEGFKKLCEMLADHVGSKIQKTPKPKDLTNNTYENISLKKCMIRHMVDEFAKEIGCSRNAKSKKINIQKGKTQNDVSDDMFEYAAKNAECYCSRNSKAKNMKIRNRTSRNDVSEDIDEDSTSRIGHSTNLSEKSNKYSAKNSKCCCCRNAKSKEMNIKNGKTQNDVSEDMFEYSAKNATCSCSRKSKAKNIQNRTSRNFVSKDINEDLTSRLSSYKNAKSNQAQNQNEEVRKILSKKPTDSLTKKAKCCCSRNSKAQKMKIQNRKIENYVLEDIDEDSSTRLSRPKNAKANKAQVEKRDVRKILSEDSIESSAKNATCSCSRNSKAQKMKIQNRATENYVSEDIDEDSKSQLVRSENAKDNHAQIEEKAARKILSEDSTECSENYATCSCSRNSKAQKMKIQNRATENYVSEDIDEDSTSQLVRSKNAKANKAQIEKKAARKILSEDSTECSAKNANCCCSRNAKSKEMNIKNGKTQNDVSEDMFEYSAKNVTCSCSRKSKAKNIQNRTSRNFVSKDINEDSSSRLSRPKNGKAKQAQVEKTATRKILSEDSTECSANYATCGSSSNAEEKEMKIQNRATENYVLEDIDEDSSSRLSRHKKAKSNQAQIQKRAVQKILSEDSTECSENYATCSCSRNSKAQKMKIQNRTTENCVSEDIDEDSTSRLSRPKKAKSNQAQIEKKAVRKILSEDSAECSVNNATCGCSSNTQAKKKIIHNKNVSKNLPLESISSVSESKESIIQKEQTCEKVCEDSVEDCICVEKSNEINSENEQKNCCTHCPTGEQASEDEQLISNWTSQGKSREMIIQNDPTGEQASEDFVKDEQLISNWTSQGKSSEMNIQNDQSAEQVFEDFEDEKSICSCKYSIKGIFQSKIANENRNVKDDNVKNKCKCLVCMCAKNQTKYPTTKYDYRNFGNSNMAHKPEWNTNTRMRAGRNKQDFLSVENIKTFENPQENKMKELFLDNKVFQNIQAAESSNRSHRRRPLRLTKYVFVCHSRQGAPSNKKKTPAKKAEMGTSQFNKSCSSIAYFKNFYFIFIFCIIFIFLLWVIYIHLM